MSHMLLFTQELSITWSMTSSLAMGSDVAESTTKESIPYRSLRHTNTKTALFTSLVDMFSTKPLALVRLQWICFTTQLAPNHIPARMLDITEVVPLARKRVIIKGKSFQR